MTCSFCGRHKYDFPSYVVGPGDVAICWDCAKICVELMAEEVVYWMIWHERMWAWEIDAHNFCQLIDSALDWADYRDRWWGEDCWE